MLKQLKASVINELSMNELLGVLNDLSYKLSVVSNNTYNPQTNMTQFTDEENNLIWLVADGGTDSHVRKIMEGRCSIQTLIDNTPEVLEKLILTKIQDLLNIYEKYEIVIDEYFYQFITDYEYAIPLF